MPHCFGVLLAVLQALLQAGNAVQYVSETPKTFSASLPTDPRLVVGFVSDSSKLPGPSKELSSRPQYVMTANDGKQFTCYTFNSTTPASQELQPLQGQIFPPAVPKSPFELLDSLTGLCLYRQQGLWTYEWCHRKGVRQIRQEASTQKGEEFTCGSWPGDEVQVEDIKEDRTISSVPLKYVSHNFTGGDACTLTGEPRTAEVRFTCMKDTTDSIIVSVKEFPTCNYVYVVATPFLCKHPEFKPQPEAVSSITCVPQSQDHSVVLTEAVPSQAAVKADAQQAVPSSQAAAEADAQLQVPSSEGVSGAHEEKEVPNSQAASGAHVEEEVPSSQVAAEPDAQLQVPISERVEAHVEDEVPSSQTAAEADAQQEVPSSQAAAEADVQQEVPGSDGVCEACVHDNVPSSQVASKADAYKEVNCKEFACIGERSEGDKQGSINMGDHGTQERRLDNGCEGGDQCVIGMQEGRHNGEEERWLSGTGGGQSGASNLGANLDDQDGANLSDQEGVADVGVHDDSGSNSKQLGAGNHGSGV